MSAPVATPPKAEKCPTCGANQAVEKNPERGQILRLYRALLKEQLSAMVELTAGLEDGVIEPLSMAAVQASAATIWTTWEKKRLI